VVAASSSFRKYQEVAEIPERSRVFLEWSVKFALIRVGAGFVRWVIEVTGVSNVED
jgi:hypothetical protein